MKKLITAIVAAFTLSIVCVSTASAFGMLIEGWSVTSSFGAPRLATTNAGITHNLAPQDWIRFRVKVTHEDSSQLQFASDGFAPTADSIQLCSDEGCDALPIELSNENVDWNDNSKVTFYLEAKECVLCSWTTFEVSQN